MRTVGDGVISSRQLLALLPEVSSTVAIEIMTAAGTTRSHRHIHHGCRICSSSRSMRWGVARKIVTAWFVTLPATMALGEFIALPDQLCSGITYAQRCTGKSPDSCNTGKHWSHLRSERDSLARVGPLEFSLDDKSLKREQA